MLGGAVTVGATPLTHEATTTMIVEEEVMRPRVLLVVPNVTTHHRPTSIVEDIPGTDAFGVRNQVICSPFDRPNTRECTYVAPFSGQFCLAFSGTDTNSFEALSLTPFSGYVGPYPGTFFTNCCVQGGVPGQSCQYDDLLALTYADTCNGQPGYSRTIAACFDLGGGQELIFTTSSNGLFRRMQDEKPLAAPKETPLSPALVDTKTAFQARIAEARQWQAARLATKTNSTLAESSLWSVEEKATGIAIRVQCARASTPNPLECTFTATLGTVYVSSLQQFGLCSLLQMVVV